MRQPWPLGFTASGSRSKVAGSQSLVNLYAEPVENEGRTQLQLLPWPGKTLFGSIGGAKVRGQIEVADQHFACVGETLYKINTDGTTVSLGTVEGLQSVDMDSNGSQLSVVSDLKSYSVNLASLALTEIGDPDFLAASSCTSLNGYSIFTRKGTDEFGWSSFRDNTAYDGLDYAVAESNPDGLIAARAVNKDLWLCGTKTAEIYYNSGNPDQFFEPRGIPAIEIGFLSRDAITVVDGSLIWVGRDGRAGGAGVYQARGYQAKKISAPKIDAWLEAYADLSMARAFAFQMLAHSFYVLTLPGTVTLVFDLSTGTWLPYVRTGTWPMGTEPGGEWDAVTFATNGRNRIVGGADGNLYKLDPDVYTDAGETIIRQFRPPQISRGRNGFTTHRIDLDFEAGVGLATGQGSDPKVMMAYSRDGYRTFSSPEEAGLGAVGEYTKRAFWCGLGHSTDLGLEVRVSDPVKTVFLGLAGDIEEHAA